MIWPYFSNVKVTVATEDSRKCREFSAKNVEIKCSLIVKNLERKTASEDPMVNIEQVIFKINLDYIKTPPRAKRVLIDQYHSLKYPENGYILRDSLLNSEYPYEWNGDHIFTNYVHLH